MKKKIIILSLTFVAVSLLSSCGKRCWCYEPYNGRMVESETYTDESQDCYTLSTRTRTCVEDFERMDPSQLADPYKK